MTFRLTSISDGVFEPPQPPIRFLIAILKRQFVQSLHKTVLALGIAAPLSALSCHTAFEPLAPMEPHPVFYSLITTARDTQFVKVAMTRGERTSSNTPDNLNPIITLSRAGQSAQTDTYSSSVQAYPAFPFRAEFGATHTLSVVTQEFGTIEATATIPQSASFDIAGRSTLDAPEKSPSDITVRVTFHPSTRAFRLSSFLSKPMWCGAQTRPSCGRRSH